MEKVKNGSCIRRVLFTFAMSYKRKWLYRGANTPLINVFIMSSIRYTLGGRIRAVLSGGAPISPKTQEFLRLALCCPIQQGYGLTETGCAGTISDQDDLSSGHVGAPLACTHIKLVDWEEGGYTTADVPGPRGEIWIGGKTHITCIKWFVAGKLSDWQNISSFQRIGQPDNFPAFSIIAVVLPLVCKPLKMEK